MGMTNSAVLDSQYVCAILVISLKALTCKVCCKLGKMQDWNWHVKGQRAGLVSGCAAKARLSILQAGHSEASP